MSALPNPLHTDRKPPAQAKRPAKLNRYGRDPGSPGERLRASSDYDTEKGYAPLYHGFLADLPRLTSGGSCTLLVLTLLSKSLGRSVPKGKPREDWTSALSVEDLAQICRCDVRTVERELAALDKRGLAEIRRPGKGEVEARLRYRDWEGLPDYQSPVVKMPAQEKLELTEDTESQRVTGKKPVRLAAGALSKAFPVSCGVKTFRHKAEGPVDLEFTCVVQAGELLVVSRFPDDWAEKVQNEIPRSNGINENTSFPRHGCREEAAKVERKPAPAVTHPRAPELVKLFDPILAASASRLLSGDTKALQSACEAVGDCEHDFLVKFSIQRAERPVKSPLHVSTICGEALASWKASQRLDRAGFPKRHDAASKEEIDALIEQERAERLRRKR